ncbi:MAG: hypothetical protein RBS46_04315 [Methyloversatilis sp.]|jgi:hypothetical protein|nr:hypothetical protein [Methyloversatilis sp.]
MKQSIALILLVVATTGAQADEPPERAYVRAGTDRLISACTRDGHTLSLLARPGVEVMNGDAAPAGLPVDAFMQGIAEQVMHLTRDVPHADFLRPDSPGARSLSDAVETWMDAFNRTHGTRLAWAISDFGVSDAPQPACASPKD